MIRKSKGFTLVELLIVIVILGILSSVMFVGISSAIRAARVASCEQKIKNVGNLLLQYRAKNGDKYPDKVGLDFYLQIVQAGLIDGYEAKDVKTWTIAELKDTTKFVSNVFQCPFEPNRNVSYRTPKINIGGSAVKQDQGILGDDTATGDNTRAYHGDPISEGFVVLTKGGQFKTIKGDITVDPVKAYLDTTDTTDGK